MHYAVEGFVHLISDGILCRVMYLRRDAQRQHERGGSASSRSSSRTSDIVVDHLAIETTRKKEYILQT